MKVTNALVAGYCVLVALAAFPFNASAQELDLKKLETQVKAPTVRIVDGPQEAVCSATVVSSKRDEKTAKVKTIILTAQHCVKEHPYRNFEVQFPRYNADGLVVSRDTYVGKIAKQGSDTNDLAIITLADTQTSFADRVAKVADRDVNPTFGEKVITSGYAFGMGLGVTEGRFNSREEFPFPDEDKETTFYRASPAVAPGNSGGGFYRITSTGDFELIGVTDWIAGKAPSTFGAYTPVDRVYDFLSDYDSEAFPKKEDKK